MLLHHIRGYIGRKMVGGGSGAAAAASRWIVQLHTDVPKAAKFYKQGLDFTINVCTLRWAELQSGHLNLALLDSSNEIAVQKGCSSLLSFTVTDINASVTKLMALGAQMDGPIKHEVHGKVLVLFGTQQKLKRVRMVLFLV